MTALLWQHEIFLKKMKDRAMATPRKPTPDPNMLKRTLAGNPDTSGVDHVTYDDVPTILGVPLSGSNLCLLFGLMPVMVTTVWMAQAMEWRPAWATSPRSRNNATRSRSRRARLEKQPQQSPSKTVSVSLHRPLRRARNSSSCLLTIHLLGNSQIGKLRYLLPA
jgi:hypothetical protein